MNKEKFYITTPIYYPSGKLHIGHSYTTVAADAMARYKRLKGYEVMFLTGTDEHGQKIQQKAESMGLAPKTYIDQMIADIKDLWKLMDISYDRFIRTTDEHHEKAVQQIFQQLYEQGDIYKGEYEGFYCTTCEAFWTEAQLDKGYCPDCGGEVHLAKEESYFFKLSKYQEPITKLLRDNEHFAQPRSRANEMLKNFVEAGLEDLAVSRTSFDWGIKVPFDPKHVIYVWIDALSNYITALGYPEKTKDFTNFWPADIQLVGKEIIRFHIVIWPALLMALNLPLPKQVFAHGWLLFKEGKMSKSKGNVVDPVILCDKYGVDAIRYFLLREVPFGADGNFSNEALIQRINSDLANDLGNLLSRTVAMIQKYFPEGLPSEREAGEFDEALIQVATATKGKVEAHMEELQFSQALAAIWQLISKSNKYIDETMPWSLAKDDTSKLRLAAVLYNLAESLRIIAVLLQPFLTATPLKIFKGLGIFEDKAIQSFEQGNVFGLYPITARCEKQAPIFPRIDLEKDLAELDSYQAATGVEKEAVVETKADVETKATINYDDFSKLDLRVGKILQCEKVAGADKLLCSQVDLGNEQRQIVSGIALSYTPEEMIGKEVVVVTNLAPRKIRGLMSAGMLLCAEKEDKLILISPEQAIGAGSVVS